MALQSVVTTTIEIDRAGTIFLTRTRDVFDGDQLIAHGQPDRQQIAPDATTGFDAFNRDGNGVPATVPLSELTGDKWPALQALMAASPAPVEAAP